MDVKLKVIEGAKAGTEIPVRVDQFVIGRSDACHLRPKSELISRRHCELIVNGTQLSIRDFGSKNGTYVNDDRVDGECHIEKGDRIKIGPLHFEVSTTETLGGKKRPKVQSVEEAAVRTADGAPADRPIEMDIAGWLAEGGEPAIPTSRGLATKDTTRIDIRANETVDRAIDESVINKPTVPSDSLGDSSQQAAAEVLRRMKRGQ